MAETKNFLSYEGLALVWAKIKNILSDKVDKETGKGLSSNDYTSDEKTKLANVAAGAQVNVLEGIQKNGANVTIVNKIANIEVPTKTSDITNDGDGNSPYATQAYVGTNGGKIDTISVNGTAQTITNKNVNITVPTKTSDITNDSGFITTSDIPEGAAASTTSPLMDGTATVGTELAFARGDHRHPTDTSRAPLASPTFTGTPKAPTAAAGTNTTQIATTAFVTSAVSAAIGDLAGVEFSIVNSLPATGDASTIYLVSASDGSGDDVYDEYIWLTANTAFEKIGTTRVDLSDYYNTSNMIPITSAQIDTVCV